MAKLFKLTIVACALLSAPAHAAVLKTCSQAIEEAKNARHPDRTQLFLPGGEFDFILAALDESTGKELENSLKASAMTEKRMGAFLLKKVYSEKDKYFPKKEFASIEQAREYLREVFAELMEQVRSGAMERALDTFVKTGDSKYQAEIERFKLLIKLIERKYLPIAPYSPELAAHFMFSSRPDVSLPAAHTLTALLEAPREAWRFVKTRRIGTVWYDFWRVEKQVFHVQSVNVYRAKVLQRLLEQKHDLDAAIEKRDDSAAQAVYKSWDDIFSALENSYNKYVKVELDVEYLRNELNTGMNTSKGRALTQQERHARIIRLSLPELSRKAAAGEFADAYITASIAADFWGMGVAEKYTRKFKTDARVQRARAKILHGAQKGRRYLKRETLDSMRADWNKKFPLTPAQVYAGALRGDKTVEAILYVERSMYPTWYQKAPIVLKALPTATMSIGLIISAYALRDKVTEAKPDIRDAQLFQVMYSTKYFGDEVTFNNALYDIKERARFHRLTAEEIEILRFALADFDEDALTDEQFEKLKAAREAVQLIEGFSSLFHRKEDEERWRKLWKEKLSESFDFIVRTMHDIKKAERDKIVATKPD